MFPKSGERKTKPCINVFKEQFNLLTLIKTGLTQISKEDVTSSLDSKVETLEVMQPGIKNNQNPKFYSCNRLLTVVID